VAEEAKTCSRGHVINSLVILASVPFWLHYLMKLVYIVKMYYKKRKGIYYLTFLKHRKACLEKYRQCYEAWPHHYHHYLHPYLDGLLKTEALILYCISELMQLMPL